MRSNLHNSQVHKDKSQTNKLAFKMTTSKTSNRQGSSKLKIKKLKKHGKQNTTVSHVSQSNPTQATIALVVSNRKHAKLVQLKQLLL